jgi:outer membrane lipoprotein-sorting protein
MGSTYRSRGPIALLLLGLVLATAVDAQTWGLPQLMAALQSGHAEQVSFEERRELALLDVPLVLRGTLTYRAPDLLRKEVIAPEHQVFEVDGERLTIESSEGSREVSVNAYPALAAFVAAYRATLAGDLATLRQHYDPQLTGSRTSWTLRLRPRSAELARYLSEIVFRGSAERIRSIESLESSGDKSVMQLGADS